MHEYTAGTLHSGSKKGPKVVSRKQAIAIALSEAGLSKSEEDDREVHLKAAAHHMYHWNKIPDTMENEDISEHHFDRMNRHAKLAGVRGVPQQNQELLGYWKKYALKVKKMKKSDFAALVRKYNESKRKKSVLMKDQEELPLDVGFDIGHKVHVSGKHGVIHDINTDGHRMYHIRFKDGSKAWHPHDEVERAK